MDGKKEGNRGSRNMGIKKTECGNRIKDGGN